jgi:hypothetical protein
MAVSEFLEEFSLASACVSAFAAGRLKAVKKSANFKVRCRRCAVDL